jgi:ribosome-associated protein
LLNKLLITSQPATFNLITCNHFLEVNLEANELAHAVVEIAAGKKAANILMLDMREVTLLADYYVLCEGSSSRQIRAVGDELLEKLKHAGSRLASVEGTPESGWMLIDFGSVIAHILSPEQRAYYQLEELWQHAPKVVRIL